MDSRRTILNLVLGLLVLLPIGCSKHPNDDQIKTEIQSKVAADPETSASDVDVSVKDGKVTLQGKVRSSAARSKVEEIAKAEPGVSSLDDVTSVEPDLAANTAAAPM